jgi:AcrR family transcriptional regulator
MKTRDRILHTSLQLFNHEGEQNVTTVDIANEMDISPGNLYYHFRGKESIINELYNEFDHELSSLLQQANNGIETLEHHWLFIYVVFEEIYKFRFFYLNASEMLLRYPEIERRFRRLLQLKVSTIETLCKTLTDQETIEADQVDITLLAENITLSFIYWFPYQHLLHPKLSAEQQIHKAVYYVLSLLAPYSGDDHQAYIKAIKQLYKSRALN